MHVRKLHLTLEVDWRHWWLELRRQPGAHSCGDHL